jgi:hypothetical protein
MLLKQVLMRRIVVQSGTASSASLARPAMQTSPALSLPCHYCSLHPVSGIKGYLRSGPYTDD